MSTGEKDSSDSLLHINDAYKPKFDDNSNPIADGIHYFLEECKKCGGDIHYDSQTIPDEMICADCFSYGTKEASAFHKSIMDRLKSDKVAKNV